MKKLLQKIYDIKGQGIFKVVALLMFCSATFSQQVSVTISASGTWTPPAGVTSIQVEAWGGGGGGGGSTTSSGRAGGGGAGGSYVKYTNVPVTNTAYTIVIGAGGTAGNTGSSTSNAGNGGSTTATFGSTAISAVGGIGGNGTSLGTNASNGLGAGVGGPSVTTGNSQFAAVSTYGGAGASGSQGVKSGGGGGGAGAANGGDASTLGTDASGGIYGGAALGSFGVGGAGNLNSASPNRAGLPGNLPGGGGSGGYGSAKTGGAGAPGQMIITYTPVTPTITLSASSLSGFGSSTNSVSTSQSINVSAVNLSANITATASTNFEISTSSTSGFGSSITIPFGAGTVTATPIYIRVKSGATVGLLSEAITFASTSATTQSLTCSGTVVTNYYYKGTGSLATLSNWGTNTDGTGTNPPDFGSVTNYQAFVIRNTSSVETDAPFTIGIVGTSSVNKLVIGDPTTTAVSLTISFANPITFCAGTKLDITAANSGNNEVIFKNASTTIPALGTIDSSANITYANGSTGITGTPCNTLKITNNTAVTLTSTPNCKYLVVDSGCSIVAASAYFITILSGGNAIINGSISGARSQGIFTTDAANKGTIYGVDLNTPITLGANSTIIYNRTSAQTISPLNYANLKVSITGTGSLSASASLSGTLTVDAGATFNTGGFLTLKSDANGTARVAPVSGTITGNVTVERYIPAKRAWRALTSPVSTTTSIFANWQENGANSGAGNGVNGLEIWAPTAGAGLTTGGTRNSLLSYNSTGNTWTGIAATNATDGTSSMMSGDKNKPFMAFVIGPYGSTTSSNITTNIAAATTLRATGALITGTQSYASAGGEYTFIGNPYASPLDISLMLNDSENSVFGPNIWVWDAKATGTYSVGAYNTFDIANSSYTNITNPAIPGDITLATGTLVQSGQAFFVKQSSLNSANFKIKEAHKGTITSNAVFRIGAHPETLRVGLYKQENNEWNGRDGAMTVLLADADANQAPNKMNNGSENIVFTKNGASFASNHHLPLVASDVLNVKVWNATVGANYKLKINTEDFVTTNLDATLEDLFTNSRTPLALDGTAVEYPFTVTTDALSTGDRFRIVFQSSTLGTNNPKANGFSIVPNPVTGDAFQVNLGTLPIGTYTYSICNTLGQEVEKGSINNAAQNTNHEVKMSNSATGIYLMKIKGSDNSVFTAKIIRK